MLLQSHEDELHLLPALPSAWPNGEVKGLRARGGFIIDLIWHDGAVKTLRLHSLLGHSCRIRIGNEVETFKTNKGESYTFDYSDGLTLTAK